MILVLGAPAAQQTGARNWAGGRPNIIRSRRHARQGGALHRRQSVALAVGGRVSDAARADGLTWLMHRMMAGWRATSFLGVFGLRATALILAARELIELVRTSARRGVRRMLLSKLALQRDWKKAAGRHSLPRHCSQVPRYAGRWPFIGAAAPDGQGGSLVSAARLEKRYEPGPSRGSARAEVSGSRLMIVCFPPFAAILSRLWELQRELASLSRWPSLKAAGALDNLN